MENNYNNSSDRFFVLILFLARNFEAKFSFLYAIARLLEWQAGNSEAESKK